MRKFKDNMFVLVDTRLSEEQETGIARRWTQHCYFNSLASNSRGMAVLMRDTLDVTDIEWQNVIKGNYSRLTFTYNKQRYLIKCIYAPNKDSMEYDENNESNKFFKEVIKDNGDMEYEHIIMAGDFKVAPNHAEDTSGYLHVNNPNTRKFLKTQIALNNLTDIWRNRNPGKK